MRLFTSFLAYIHSSPSGAAGRAIMSSQVWNCLDLLSFLGIWTLVSNRWITADFFNLLRVVQSLGGLSWSRCLLAVLPSVVLDFSAPQSLGPGQLTKVQDLMWAAERT